MGFQRLKAWKCATSKPRQHATTKVHPSAAGFSRHAKFEKMRGEIIPNHQRGSCCSLRSRENSDVPDFSGEDFSMKIFRAKEK
jgi:hypothetical protein